MIKLLLTTAILLTSQLIQAQTKFRRGLYKDFENINTNSPSDSLRFPIETKTKTFGTAMGNGYTGSRDGQETYYRLRIKKKEANGIGEIIGFSDGKNLFLSTSKVNPALKKSLFSPAERINDSIYIFNHYYSSYGFQSAYNIATGSLGSAPASSVTESMYVFNTEGSVSKLTADHLAELLKRDAELSLKFEKERSKEGLLLYYLIRLLDDGLNY